MPPAIQMAMLQSDKDDESVGLLHFDTMEDYQEYLGKRTLAERPNG